MKHGQKGQALLEWAIFGVAVLSLWASSIHLARRLLNRTVSESWSMVAARHSLSRAPFSRPGELQVNTQIRDETARSQVRFQDSAAEARIDIPKIKRGLLGFSSLSSGSPSSPSSE